MDKPITYIIDIKKISNSHETIIQSCYNLIGYYHKNPDAKIIIDFRNIDFMYPDYSILLLCAIKHLDKLGIKVSGRIRYNTKSSIVPYLARINFFKYLNIQIPGEFKRLENNRFVEIQEYNENNQIKVLKSILTVIKENSLINDNVFASLDYCLNEILDNVLNHSEVKVGWVVAQYFEKMNAIRIMVADNGIGIHKSLNKRHNFSEIDSIENCINSGVTNGLGQGHGLYATSTFTKMNKGWLSLISGNKKLDVSEKYTKTNTVSFWQGTCVYLRVNTNVDVDYKKFTSNHFDYKEQLFEDMFK